MERNKKLLMYFPSDKKKGFRGELEVVGEGPRVLTVETVRYWCRHTKELKGAQVSKAEKFVRYECLHYVGDNRFVCLPLNTVEGVVFEGKRLRKVPFGSDYNSSEYVIRRVGKTFECNCQGWCTREKRYELVVGGANCSHVLALYFAFKLKRFKRELVVKWGER